MREKINRLAGIIIVMSVITLSSCYYDIDEELYPQTGNCDSTAATYSGTVAPLMQSQCVSCHNTSLASGGIALDSYTAVKAQAANGKLYGSVNYSAGYSPMPQGGNKLSSCTLIKIKAWINAGALNN